MTRTIKWLLEVAWHASSLWFKNTWTLTVLTKPKKGRAWKRKHFTGTLRNTGHLFVRQIHRWGIRWGHCCAVWIKYEPTSWGSWCAETVTYYSRIYGTNPQANVCICRLTMAAHPERKDHVILTCRNWLRNETHQTKRCVPRWWIPETILIRCPTLMQPSYVRRMNERMIGSCGGGFTQN